MTLGRRSARPAQAIQNPPPAENTSNGNVTYDGYIRGLSDLPPAIQNKEDRPLIRPIGKTHWKDIPKIRKGRQPSGVLTCLLKRHHLGIIDYEGEKVLATTWEHYQAVKDNLDHSVANKIEDAFWLRYNYEDDFVDMARQHVGRCCKQLLTSVLYYARIQAIIDHFRATENTNVNDKLAGKYYLKKEEYLAQRQTWCSKAGWAALSEEWATPEWIEKSKTTRLNRTKSKFKTHKGGSNSMTTISQKMSEQKGEEVNQIEAWVHTHRGPDENNPEILNSAEATACLERYTKKTKELHGAEFDWKKNPISSKALYDSSLGKPHGRWALFNGVLNDTDIIAEVRAGVTSSTAFKRHRSEQMADELRRESEKFRKAETYTNNVLSWGIGMYDHCNGIQKLLETLATNQGVPINQIPPPPPPPPARSPSPCRSPLGSPYRSSVHILDNSQDPLALCAQEHADHCYVQEHIVSSNVSAQDLNIEPTAGQEGMFGGFFSESGTGAISLSLLL